MITRWPCYPTATHRTRSTTAVRSGQTRPRHGRDRLNAKFKAWPTRLDGDSLPSSKDPALFGGSALPGTCLQDPAEPRRGCRFRDQYAALTGAAVHRGFVFDMLIDEVSGHLVVATDPHATITAEGIGNRQRAALIGRTASQPSSTPLRAARIAQRTRSMDIPAARPVRSFPAAEVADPIRHSE